MSDAARSAAASSMSAMEFPSDAAAMPPGGEVPPMPEEGGGDPAADVESALEQIAMALEAMSPDAASKARAHIEGIREIVASAGAEGQPPAEELPPADAEAPALGGGLEGGI